MDSTSLAFRIDGGRALVTGASRGIGRATAEALADAGCDLVLAARSEAALEGVVESVRERGRKAFTVVSDLGDNAAAGAIVVEAAAALGGLDVLVHNAGIGATDVSGEPLMVPLQELPLDEWTNVVTVNLGATAALCKAAYPYLRESDRASVVLMSSALGVMGGPSVEAYTASKAGQISLAKSLGVGWAREGIRVNALCPGWVRTDATAFATQTPAVSDWLMAHVPLGRWAEPADAARAAVFLASPAAAFVTGHALVMDGGASVADSGLAGIPKPTPPFGAK